MIISLCFWFSVADWYTGRWRGPDQSRATRSASDGSTIATLWPVNANDNLIARSRQEDRQRRSPQWFGGSPQCKLSPSPNQIDDRGPDGRRQGVPACDQLPECLSLPAHFRPATKRRVVTTIRTSRYANSDAGAIPAAPPRYRRFVSTHRYPCDRVLPGSVIAAVRYADGAQLSVPERYGQRGRIGNKMGTGLAISAQCGYNVRASGQYRNCLAIKAFKYHRNVFPIPRVWQTYRTQNPVRARGCGFKSHLRY